jgi:hypothetical protein
MRKSSILAAVVLVAGVVAGGVMAAVSTKTGGGERPAQSSVEIPLGGEGPNCIGGLCLENLPESIKYAEVGAYLGVLREALREDPRPETANMCHTMAHEIGRRAIKDGSTVQELLNLDDGGCLYGYQHGVLEGWSLRSSLADLVRGIPEACRAYDAGGTLGGLGAGEMGYAKGSCAHGLGHAIALQNIGSVEEAVSYCEGAGMGQIGGCAGGVFMAYSSENPSQGGEAAELRLQKEEVLGLCPRLAGEYQAECWSKLWLLGSRVGIGALEVAAICPPSGAENCGRGVGEGLFYENRLEAREALQKCPKSVADQCAYGVAWAAANVWVGEGNSREEYQSICAEISGIDPVVCRQNEEAALAGAVR